MKLELGADRRRLGWFATGMSGDVDLLVDATGQFPFEDSSVDYVFSEHMIEHVPFQGGRAMMRECFRVLKPGGVVRIVTPSIEFLYDLFGFDYSGPEIAAYIEWATRLFNPDSPRTACTVFNNFVRAWGHQFIYDEPTLANLFTDTGFQDLCSPAISHSEHEELRNLENVSRMPAGFLALESQILEGTKP